MRTVGVALAVGAVLLAGALAAVLSGSPIAVIGTNSVPVSETVEYVAGGFHTCQPTGTLPRGTTAIRLSASANTGPRITLKVSSEGRPVTAGERDTGWGVDQTVTVPVKRVTATVVGAKACIAFGPVIEGIGIKGVPVRSSRPDAKAAGGVFMRLEYLRSRDTSWWSLLGSVVRRMGYGHAPSGTWVVFVLIALMVAVAALVARALLGEPQ